MEKADLLKLGDLDPELVETLKSFPGMPSTTDILWWQNFEQSRRATVLTALGGPPPGVIEQDHQVKTRDGAHITIRSYSPADAPSDGSPLIVLFHGGGFSLGGLETETPNSRKFASQLGAVVLNVDYRLAPQNPFPAAINDAWDALKWAVSSASTLKADLSKGFIVGGTSAGGNLVAVLTHLARNENLSPPLTGQYLSVPTLLSPEIVPEQYRDQYLSQEQNKDSPILTAPLFKMFLDSYNPDYTSPLFATFNDPTGHANLPPAYFQICGADLLRDDGILYERLLRQDQGIATRVDIYPGLPHMFWTIFPGLSQAKKWADDTVKGMQWLLEQTPKKES